MFGFFGKSSNLPETWKTIESLQELQEAEKASFEKPLVLFKHSTSCSISSMAKSRLEGASDGSSPTIYYLDLLSHRDISNEIASRFKVRHESPQVVVLDNGKVQYHASHGAINMNDLVENTQ
jgi:bacillithiol system protein YtxJ